MPEPATFPHLFRPIRLGTLEIRNRIVFTGHGTGMGRDFSPDERMIAYYEARAAGGVGLIMLGSQQVHPSSPGITNLLCNYDDTILPGLAAVAEAVHRHGRRVFGYLSHMGLASTARPLPLWSASPIYEQKYGEVAHPMSEGEIAELVEAFAAAAARCIAAGLDGIEVHCGHGLLLHQFLSPLTNRRTDRYGGSVGNRIRFPVEVLAAVRDRIGPDVPLGIRCSADELIPGGLTVDDMAEIVPQLVAGSALDYVDVSAGNDGNLVSNMLHEPPMGLAPAPFASLSRRIREVVAVPVIHGTRIHTAAEAEGLIARGDADMAGMCRALIADPELPRKALGGEADTVIPCVGCEQACFGRLFAGRFISCVGNPRSGREAELGTLRPADEPRSVLVIGGGPAGMEAARVAALAGHAVTLAEQSDTLGGRMHLAAIPPGRSEWRRLIEHKAAELRRRGVIVETRRQIDASGVAARRPDAVIVATGEQAAMPPLPGIDLPHVRTLDAAVAAPDDLGRAVLVIDYLDRQPALVAALLFADRGAAVTLSTPAFHVGQRLVIQNLTHLYREALSRGIVFRPLAEPVAITPSGAILRNPLVDGTFELSGFDSVVVAAAGRPDERLAPAIAALEIPVRVIGDAYAPRDIEAAILEGYLAGRDLLDARTSSVLGQENADTRSLQSASI